MVNSKNQIWWCGCGAVECGLLTTYLRRGGVCLIVVIEVELVRVFCGGVCLFVAGVMMECA